MKPKMKLNNNYDKRGWLLLLVPAIAIGHYPEGWQIAASWLLWEIEIDFLKSESV